jgi:hypothetical protein
MAKVRSDCVLLNLPEEQQEKLGEWLLVGRMSYQKARRLLKKEFGVAASDSQLSRFWDAYCSPLVRAQRSRSAGLAIQLGEEISKSPGNWDAPLIDQVKQAAFEAMQGRDPDQISKLLRLVLKVRDQDLKQEAVDVLKRRLSMLESRQADAKDKLDKAKQGGGLSPEALKRIEEAAAIL